jgi:membrane fusion protein
MTPSAGAAPTLFRAEAATEAPFGEALVFNAPSWGLLGLLAFAAVLLFLAFGFLTSFDRVSQVRGIVTPASGVSRIVAPHAGIVTAVLAQQGEPVEKGAPIARIASGDFLPSGAAAPSQMLETYRRQQRIALAAQDTERQRGAAERLRLVEEESELAAAINSLRDQLALQRELIASNAERLHSLGSLRARGYVSEFTYQAQQEAVLALRQQLAALGQRLAEAEHGFRQARLRIVELAAQARHGELQTTGTLVELERGAANAQVAAEVTLLAPMAGVVSAMRVAPGMAVAAAEQIAAVVRPSDRMEVLLFVPSGAVGALRPGQEVVLRYDAFPYQRHGVGRGAIIDIASSANIEQPGTPPRYRVRVRILDGGHFALRPDMELSASITLERRTLLDWLLAPLRESWLDSRRRGAA